MIPAAEVRALRAEWSLRDDIIEKDYALGWILAGIAAEEDLATTWIFKGGTCLRKCYYETYRFSEDLDFTVVDRDPRTPRRFCRSSAESARGSPTRPALTWNSMIAPSPAG